jgi:predicted  nucleic acid-binding Zn-ribbon protein
MNRENRGSPSSGGKGGGGGGVDDDFQDMTKEELIEAIELLQKELDECNDEIQDLNQKNMKLQRQLKRSPGGGGDEDEDGMKNVLDSVALETENDELREKLSKMQAELTQVKEKNLELKSQAKIFQNEKTEADADLRNLRKKIDDLEKTLSESEESMRANLRKSQDITKQKKDTQKQQLQLFDENERLQKEVLNYLNLSLFSNLAIPE